MIEPIERMVQMVKRMADNPLAALRQQERNFYQEELEIQVENNDYETELLETMLTKIGG